MAVLGVDVGGTKLLMLAGEPGNLRSRKVATGPDFTPAQLKQALAAFIQDLGEPVERIGIALPGLVIGDHELRLSDVLPALQGLKADDLAPLAGRVRLINDVRAALHHETAAEPNVDTAVVMIGTGIGAAIQQGGRVLEGSRGWAGELGSIPLATDDGPRTLDQLASGASLLARAGVDADTLNARLAAGDPATQALVHQAGHCLGLGIATLVNLLNPQRIVLGGGTLHYPGYLQAALDAAQRHSLEDLWNACSITRSRNPEQMAALGAQRFAAL